MSAKFSDTAGKRRILSYRPVSLLQVATEVCYCADWSKCRVCRFQDSKSMGFSADMGTVYQENSPLNKTLEYIH